MTDYFVIAARKYRDKGYRTRYYVECRDGRVCVGEKQSAARFEMQKAVRICAQLRTLAPCVPFIVIGEDERPPRKWDGAFRPPPKPHQVDAFDDGLTEEGATQ